MHRLSEKTEVPLVKFVEWLGIARAKFYEWRRRYGKLNEHNGKTPRESSQRTSQAFSRMARRVDGTPRSSSASARASMTTDLSEGAPGLGSRNRA
nr:hypothetical protein [Nannocystis exedens]